MKEQNVWQTIWDSTFRLRKLRNLRISLSKKTNRCTEDGKTPVAWNFSTMPSEEWKNGVGSALTAYAADQTDANWDAVVSAFVDGWASEYKLANE